MPVFSRASRRYRFVPGKGGNLIVRQYSANGLLLPNAITFDVGQYGIKRFYQLENTSHSGDNGGESYTQVGHAWRFAASVSFPAALLVGTGKLAAVFAEEFLGSPLGFDVIFNIGDPEYWTLQGLTPRTYRGHARAEIIETNSVNAQTVKLNVEGVGEGLLLSQVAGNTVAPLVESKTDAG